MSHHHASHPRGFPRFGLPLAIGLTAFTIGLVGGFISGMRSERLEHEREAQRSKFAVERSGQQIRELERRVGELDRLLAASKDDADKSQGLKPGETVHNTRK